MTEPHFYRLRKEAVGKDQVRGTCDGEMRKGLLNLSPLRHR